MELIVNAPAVPEAIQTNLDDVKSYLAERLKYYEGLVYTDDQIRTAKEDRANLNRLKKAINDRRIAVKKEYMKPVDEFEDKVLEVVTLIDKPVKLIDKQVKEYEEKKRQEKEKMIRDAYANRLDTPEWLTVDMIWNPKWLNATVSLKAVETEITEWIKKINADLSVIAMLPAFSFEATEVYKKTLNMESAIREGDRMAEIQRRKEEDQRRREEAEMRLAEERERQRMQDKADAEEAAGQGAQEPTEAYVDAYPPETPAWVNFSACVTVSQARELKAFFDSRGIPFRAI